MRCRQSFSSTTTVPSNNQDQDDVHIHLSRLILKWLIRVSHDIAASVISLKPCKIEGPHTQTHTHTVNFYARSTFPSSIISYCNPFYGFQITSHHYSNDELILVLALYCSTVLRFKFLKYSNRNRNIPSTNLG